MIAKNTVLILGAGASRPYGLPLGTQLRDEVLRGVERNAFSLAMRARGTTAHEYERFAHDLATSGFSSVDAFLEQRPSWTEIGKAAMSLCLLSAEVEAKPRLFPPGQPGDHWYQTLWNRLGASSWHAFKKQPLHVLTFNYDRTFEHYFAQVLSNNYGVKPDTAVRGLRVYHLHGSLGPYDSTSFGTRLTDASVDAACSSIRVVHEAGIAHSEFALARRLIDLADQVLFVGFGYLDTNMRKLGFGGRRDEISGPMVLGTHKGFKARAWENICAKYWFSLGAAKQGAGSISDFVADWVS